MTKGLNKGLEHVKPTGGLQSQRVSRDSSAIVAAQLQEAFWKNSHFREIFGFLNGLLCLRHPDCKQSGAPISTLQFIW
jgi:hypothetical protein